MSDQSGRWAEAGKNFYEASVSLKKILQGIDRGEGLLGQLTRRGDSGRELIENLRVSVEQGRRAAESIRRTAEKIERGEGALGTFIQDPHSGREILTRVERTAANLEEVTRRLRDDKGLLQRLIEDRSYADRVLSNVENITRDLAQITAKIERGEGTLGALVHDPELYQESKGLLRRLKGSWLLSLYRFFSGSTPSEEETTSATPGTGHEVQ
jgi:phospholipid/cholesterol/gamma-HCH transport system substrate-binding protein